MGTVVLPCPGSSPLVSHSLLGPHQAYSHFSRPVVGSLTLVTRSSSTLHPGRAGSCRGGKGEGQTLEKEGGNHSGRKIVGDELFAYRKQKTTTKNSPFNLVLKSLIVLPPAGPQREALEMLLHF